MQPANPQPVWAVTPEKLHEAVRRLAAAHPCKIVLLGSRAHGRAGEDSDVDLMVIREDVKDPAAELVRLRRLLKDIVMAVDLLVVSRRDFDYWRDTPGNVFFEAAAGGRVLYETA
jgi:predicted nucleotidyltransferase